MANHQDEDQTDINNVYVDEDPCIIDLTSRKFNPKAALSSSHRQQVLSCLPCPSAKTFNNIAEYSSKTFGKKAVSKSSVTDVPLERKFTQEQIEACRPRERKVREYTTVLTRMKCPNQVVSYPEEKKEPLKEGNTTSCGPMHVLHESVGKRIKVLIRRRKFGPKDCQFSWLTAQLIAFDKHHNLILNDIDEVVTKCSSTTTFEDQEKLTRKRHLKRMFLRGDSVQIISKDNE